VRSRHIAAAGVPQDGYGIVVLRQAAVVVKARRTERSRRERSRVVLSEVERTAAEPQRQLWLGTQMAQAQSDRVTLSGNYGRIGAY
jgi:hypothetical protein